MPESVIEFIQIKMFAQHRKILALKTLNTDKNNVAIIAIYSQKNYFTNVIRLIKQLLENKISVICVINESKNSKELQRILSEYKVEVIARRNIGRDIGAYQHGIKYLNSTNIMDKIENLYLFNDSVIYPPQFKAVLNRWNKSNSMWSCLFLNFEFNLHAQSFGLRFNSEVLKSKTFNNFWKNYYPRSDRRHSINKGEIKLTKNLIKSGFVPIPYLDSNRQKLRGIIKHMSLTERALVTGEGERLTLKENEKKFSEEMLLEKTAQILISRNPTHYLGLFLTRTIGLPLKLDLVRTGLISLEIFNKTLLDVGIKEAELVQLNELVIPKGTPSSYKGLRKLWLLYGLI